jgi:hypothetical protein
MTFSTDHGVDATSLLQHDCDKRTPTQYSAIRWEIGGFDDMLTWAISEGVQPMSLLQADSVGQTPLHLMCLHYRSTFHRGSVEKTQKMLQIANRLKQLQAMLKPDHQEQTPLHLAVMNKVHSIEAIMLLNSPKK